MATLVRRGFTMISGRAVSAPLQTILRPQSFVRTLTNATKPDHVQSMQSVTRGPEKEGGWYPSLIHSSGDMKWTVIRLEPGHGEVPAHFHTQVWDYFIPLSGKAVIETKTKEGVEKNYEMQPDSFLAMPAGDMHRVRNASEDQEFVFLIAQGPRAKYDFVASKEPMAQES